METIVWIFLIASGVVLLAALSGKKKPVQKDVKMARAGRSVIRIDRPHMIDPVDHECPVCGARFRMNTMQCPNCKVLFTGMKKNEDEFVEEMEIWEDE